MKQYRKWARGNAERNAEMAFLREKERLTFREIGERFDLSTSQVRKICKDLGIETFYADRLGRKLSLEFLERNREMYRLRFDEFLPFREIGERFGITRERARQIVGDGGKDIVRKRRESQILPNHDKTNMELSEELGLSVTTISKYRSGTHFKKEYNLGLAYEWGNKISDKLFILGIAHKLVSGKCGYNILIFPDIRVRIKVATKQWKSPSLKFVSPIYKFRRYLHEKCDFYIFVIAETNDYFIVPTSKILAKETVAFCWPCNNHVGRGSSYRKYHNRWDLLQI